MNKVNLALIFCLFGFSDSCFMSRYNRALDRLNCPKEYDVWLSGKVSMTQMHFQYIFTMKTVSQSMNKITSTHHHVTSN